LTLTKGVQIFKILRLVFDITYNTNIIAETCYKGLTEGTLSVTRRAESLNTKQLINNIVFNFGRVFDSIRDTLLYFNGDTRGQFLIPYEAGLGIGNAIYLVLQQ
jgi:hypothetical protein